MASKTGKNVEKGFLRLTEGFLSFILDLIVSVLLVFAFCRKLREEVALQSTPSHLSCTGAKRWMQNKCKIGVGVNNFHKKRKLWQRSYMSADFRIQLQKIR